MHHHSDIPISFTVLSVSCAHTETHTPLARLSISGIAFNIWRTWGIVSCYISWVALYRTPACPDGSPADRDGWCLIPLLHLLCHFILSALLICHFHRQLVTLLGVRVLYICGHVCICPHKWFPDPCSKLQVGCHPYMHQGDMPSPIAICLIWCHSPSLNALHQCGSF